MGPFYLSGFDYHGCARNRGLRVDLWGNKKHRNERKYIMKILGICCSPHKGKATYTALNVCLQAAAEVDESIEVELFQLAQKKIGPCTACNGCKKKLTCVWKDDFIDFLPRLSDPDVGAIIIGTPVFFGGMASQCKAFLDRCRPFRCNGELLRNKVGGVIAVGGVRNGGQELTIQAVRASMSCHGMICVGDGKGTAHFGGALFSGGEGGVEADEIGLVTARTTGQRVAEIALRMFASK